MRDGQNGEAVSLIAKLSSLLRLALETTGQQEITLSQELEFLKRYLEIQRARFSDRMEIRLDVEAAALDACVPNLVLQPLVENAVLHGFANQTSGGCIEVHGRVDGEKLRLFVRDDGPGFAAATGGRRAGNGIGLANTRDRLARMFGDGASLAWRDRPEGGAEVEVVIPYRRRAPADVPSHAPSREAAR